MPSRKQRFALFALIAVLIAAGLTYRLTRGRGVTDGAAGNPKESAATTKVPGARPRTAPISAGPRGPIRLSEGAAIHDDSFASGSFEGRVVSWATGRGVAGATISFAHEGQTSTITAGSDGSFKLVPQELGRYEIALVAAEAYLPFSPAFGESPLSLTARAGQRIRDIRIYLEPAIEYTGVVQTPSGDPAKGASIRLYDAEGGEAKIAPLPDRFTSDERGEFKFSAPDDAVLEAKLAGFSPGRASVDWSAQASRRVVIKLGPKSDADRAVGTISGRVIDAKGAPILGAQVRGIVERKEPTAAREAARPMAEATTDERGNFSLNDLDADQYTVIASHADLAPATSEGVAVGTSGLTLTLSKGASIRGTVRDQKTGEPVAAFTIVVWTRLGPLEREILAAEAQFDAEGHYEVGGLPPGDYAVTAAAHGYAASTEATFSVPDPAADPAPIDIALSRGGRVSGVVVEEGTGKPIEGARVSLEGRGGVGPSAASVVASIATDAAGRFEIQGIGAGLRSIMVVAAEHHGRIVSGLAITEGGDVGPVTVELRKTEKGEDPKLDLVGIGAVIAPKGDLLMIQQAIEGGGAHEVGLGSGDAILAVDGIPVTTLGFEGAIQRIRGPEGSWVELTVKKAAGGPPTPVSVPRRRIHS